MRHDGSSIASSCGIQPPYLLLSPSDGVILGASESFAAHVGMTVGRLVGQTFMSVLRWLEVENREALEEVVQKVAALHNNTVAARDDEGGAECRLGPGCVDRRSLQTELRVGTEAVVESQGGEYSIVQGGQSLPRMGDGTVQRILLRGRCPCPSFSAVVSPLVGDPEDSARIHADDEDNESFTVERSFGGGEYFCLSLDVWMCPRQDPTSGFLVLCQPRLHCVLDWTPLACFLVHPVTGCVLYWSREAERQTERLAYEMLGWQSQAIPTPLSTGFRSRCHDRKYDNVGGKKEARRRGARLEPSLQAILQLPFPSAPSLSVTLQPLAGKFVEEEEVALEGAVAGLLWPPLHSLTERNTHTASDGCRAASYPPDARGSCCHRSCVGDVDGNKTPFPQLHLPERPLKNSGNPAQEKTGSCFATLARGREDASTWLSAKVPLLFTIHGEVSMPFGSVTPESCVEPGHDSMHASAGGLPEHQTVWENSTHRFVSEMLPASPTGENGVEENVFGKPLQGHGANQDTDRQPSNGVSLRRGSLTTHAPQHTESDGLQQNVCNEDEKDPSAKVTRDEASLKLPQLSTRTAVGPTPTPVSLQASLRTSQHASPILSNARRATCAESDVAGTRGGGSNANSDDRNYSSKQRGKRDDESRGCTALTPLGGRSSSKSRDVQVPRLISPLPREHPTTTQGNAEETCSETVLFGKQLGYNSQQYPQQPSYPQQTKPSLLSPQPLASIPVLSSAAGSTALSDFATTPVSNVNTANEGYPIWAMLRSGDEATIPSCVIRVPPGEGFLFGRSSQCHATTVDGFVSGIQFKIVRQLGSELQLLQPTSPRDSSHPSLFMNPSHTSTVSGPHATSAAAGNWIFVLYDQSVNGTFVNVRKVGNGKCVNLRDHDLITFRLSSSRFFLGFQFLLTNERGTPLSEWADVPAKSSGMNSSAVLRGTRPLRHRTSSETGSFFAACNSQVGGGAQSKSNGGSSSRRPASATRSRSSRAGAAAQHRETIEWKIGEELLGKGGNAEVFLGMNMTNGKLIAVKRVPLPTTASEDPNHKEVLKQYISLQEEIRVLSKAIHPNIVQYFGSSQNLQYFNILLEFVPGGSLRHLLDNFGALSPGVICSYLRQTLEGLHYLHQHNLVHSDVKAANILITEKGRVKLSDFGTAKLLNRQHSQSVDRDGKAEIADGSDAATFRLAGTLRWMAPELLRGSAGPTKASDIWSVGCTLIEMLSTEAPWSEYDFESEEQLMNLLKYTTEPPEVPECVELPELTSIARRCLTLDADSRPTCAELLQLVLEAAKRFQEQQAQLSSPADVPRVPPATTTTTSAALPPGEGAVMGASVRQNNKHEGRPQHRDPQEATDVTVSKGWGWGDCS
ncbi:protein kinase [Trypanosoma rangeli SC58]|uniref:Protein kinase n=1 Tax=Trypanosoma rangeli SC58 TaxID=429131 RepID=A0A061IY79_TRYRA|nr:protein kinase [Trypanosoma rangeli SC58]